MKTAVLLQNHRRSQGGQSESGSRPGRSRNDGGGGLGRGRPRTYVAVMAVPNSAFQYDKADQMKVIIMLYIGCTIGQRMVAIQHLRTKSDGIISIQLRVAGPEGGATGLVESICIRIWAISLCGTRTI
jgi:hypothetical protein